MSNYTIEGISQIAEEIKEIHRQAYQVYFPLTEEICSRTSMENEVEHFLDCLLDFGPDEKIFGLYKRYAGSISLYILPVLNYTLRPIERCGSERGRKTGH